MKGEQIGHESQLLVFYFEAHFDRSAPSALSLQHLGSYLAKDGVSNEEGGFSPLGAQTGPPRLPMARGAVPSPGDTTACLQMMCPRRSLRSPRSVKNMN